MQAALWETPHNSASLVSVNVQHSSSSQNQRHSRIITITNHHHEAPSTVLSTLHLVTHPIFKRILEGKDYFRDYETQVQKGEGAHQGNPLLSSSS